MGRLLVGILTFVSATTSLAQTNPQHARSMAATCAACHGTDGAAVPGEAMVALAGYPKPALIAQLKAFRDGTRSATVMHQITRGYSDAEIDAIATWFAAQPASSR